MTHAIHCDVGSDSAVLRQELSKGCVFLPLGLHTFGSYARGA